MTIPTSTLEYMTEVNYVCKGCGASECKLWSEYPVPRGFYCCDCAAAMWDVDISEINDDGTIPLKKDWAIAGERTPQIKWHCPANEDYGPLNKQAWLSLPTRDPKRFS